MEVITKWTQTKWLSKLPLQYGYSRCLSRANPVILEPMMKVEVVTPDKFMGDVTGNLSSKRGLIEGMEDRGMNKVIKAIVPLSEMFGYMTGLRSMTEGRASFTMEFFRYDIVPNNVAETIIAARK
jgi:elongation factor G